MQELFRMARLLFHHLWSLFHITWLVVVQFNFNLQEHKLKVCLQLEALSIHPITFPLLWIQFSSRSHKHMVIKCLRAESLSRSSKTVTVLFTMMQRALPQGKVRLKSLEKSNTILRHQERPVLPNQCKLSIKTRAITSNSQIYRGRKFRINHRSHKNQPTSTVRK